MKKIYKKIHLWLSVPFGIILTLICFSGSTLVFEKEITEWCRPEVYYVSEVKDQPLPIDEIMQTVSASLPDTVSATGIVIFQEKDKTWQVNLSKPRRASVYVNPYTAEITGKGDRLPFFATMFKLHRWLLGPASNPDGSMPTGKLIVGISTIMLVIVIISGLLIWLSRGRKSIKKSMKLYVTKGWKRFLHDLHVAGGIYAAVIILIMALTGLTWSFSWYRTGFYKVCGVEIEEKHQSAHGNNKENRNKAEKRGERHHAKSDNRRESPYIYWQTALEKVTEANQEYRQITITDETIAVVPSDRHNLRAADKYTFNKQSGKIKSVMFYENQDKSSKMRSSIYTIHTGSWGGIATRILWFLAALLGATLPLTGYYLWIKRIIKKKR